MSLFKQEAVKDIGIWIPAATFSAIVEAIMSLWFSRKTGFMCKQGVNEEGLREGGGHNGKT